MGKALYRKHRPKNLSEIIGQEHITSTISNALKNGQISHAYLFTGPRGVGKTSVARILAHEINGFDYNEDENYLDIIEIDAASNRRIEEVRQLRETINIAPSRGKYKVYIIDEVHMLTREAFNALLKTLEEPPDHAVFILATTEAYKVPETIVSRTQQFNFRPITAAKIFSQLKDMAEQEKINVSDAALEMIAEYGEGSFRDSISLLDQVSSINNKITEKDLISLLGITPGSVINDIFKSIEHGSVKELSEVLRSIDEVGYNLTVVCKQLIDELKRMLVEEKSFMSSDEILSLMKQIIDVPSSNDPNISLEVVLMEAILTKPTKSSNNPLVEASTETKVIDEPVKSADQAQGSDQAIDKPKKSTRTKLRNKADFYTVTWPAVINAIKTKYNTLYGVIRMAVPNLQDDTLILKTKFDFHKRLLNDLKNQTIIIDIIKDLTGEEIKIQSVVDKDLDIETREERANEMVDISQSITTINNIFGSSEVIE